MVGKMNIERIELLARSKLEGFLNRIGYVTPEISANDKSPSWDGNIRLYNDKDSSEKNNLAKMIPLQLKGHYANPPYSNLISFSIETADLQNYFNHNGVIFFVVYLNENDDYQIYYNALSPFKIRRLMKGKENQKSISVHLDILPDDKDETVDIFFNFANDMKMQLPEKDFTLEDVFKNKLLGFDTFNLSYTGIKYKDDPIGYFLNHPATVTLKHSATGITIPLDTILLEAFGSNLNKTISVNGIKFFDNFDLIRHKDNLFEMKFGKSFTYTLQKTENRVIGNFHYNLQGNLPERIHDTKFLIAYLENKEFEIDNHKGFNLKDSDINEKKVDIDYFKNSLTLLEKIDELLNKLKITSILDYDKVTEKDEETFINLINTVLLEMPCNPTDPDKLYKITIANITFLLIAKRINENKYKIINFFSEENNADCAFTYKSENETKKMFRIPPSFVLRKNDFSILDNIDYEIMYNDIISNQTSDELKEYTLYLIDEIIEGYKIRTKNKEQMKDFILKALQYLSENVNEYDYEKIKNDMINL